VPLTEALAVVVQQLLTDANSRPRGMVSVSSVPIGARVRVDGLLRGQTPYLKASFVGARQVLVEKTDFHSFDPRLR
jgi:CRISPR/Cas system-associated exonuclease Cas4 (RecB family)